MRASKVLALSIAVIATFLTVQVFTLESNGPDPNGNDQAVAHQQQSTPERVSSSSRVLTAWRRDRDDRRGRDRYNDRRGRYCDRRGRICRLLRRYRAYGKTTCCRGRCVNVNSDRRNCGRCGKRCRYSQSCCQGRCVNLNFNRRHCGRCNNPCIRMCMQGICAYA